MDKAVRKNEGKPKLTLVLSAPDAIIAITKVMQFGLEKYARDNWKKGFEKNEGIDSVLRHLLAHQNGVLIDEESGLPHLHLALTGLMMYVDNEARGTNYLSDSL